MAHGGQTCADNRPIHWQVPSLSARLPADRATRPQVEGAARPGRPGAVCVENKTAELAVEAGQEGQASMWRSNTMSGPPTEKRIPLDQRAGGSPHVAEHDGEHVGIGAKAGCGSLVQTSREQDALDGDDQADQLDPFDPAALRLSQDFASTVGVKKLQLTVPVRKPSREWFIRTHPDKQGLWLETFVLELKEDREMYLVEPKLWPGLSAETTCSARVLVTAINRQGTVFLWPIRLPGPDGRHDDWSRSALEAAEIATGGWVRVVANMNLGAYDVYRATGDLPEPEWPDVSFHDLLTTAFRNRYIDDLQHPVLRRLRGEA